MAERRSQKSSSATQRSRVAVVAGLASTIGPTTWAASESTSAQVRDWRSKLSSSSRSPGPRQPTSIAKSSTASMRRS